LLTQAHLSTLVNLSTNATFTPVPLTMTHLVRQKLISGDYKLTQKGRNLLKLMLESGNAALKIVVEEPTDGNVVGEALAGVLSPGWRAAAA
jgi:hypothetical protein